MNGDEEVSELLARVGSRVKTLREGMGMTQARLARQVGWTRSSIANLEAGRQSPPLVVAVSLAHALGTSVADLVGESGAAGDRRIHLAYLAQTRIPSLVHQAAERLADELMAAVLPRADE